MRPRLSGDWLIIFNNNQLTDLPVRADSQPWVPLREDLNLLVSQGGEKWLGYTIREIVQEPWMLYLVGELYGADHETDQDEFLRTWLRSGMKEESLNGHFILLGFDKIHRNLHIWTNRFGTIHAYYAINKDQAVVGTFFPAVASLASLGQLDWFGLSTFFAFGFFINDRTFFTDVRILRPATHYILNARGQLIQKKRYWQWWHEPDYTRSFEQTVDEFAEIFHVIMDEFTGEGRIAIPISGGLDSRSTVAAITRPQRYIDGRLKLWAYSYGYQDDSIETWIAERVARVRKLPFKSYTIQPYLFVRLKDVLDYTEGFQDITQCRQMFVRDDLMNASDILISALWGDVWFDDMGLVDSNKPVKQEFVSHYALEKIKKKCSWILEHVCRPQIGKNLEEFLQSYVSDEINKLQSIEDPDFRIKAFKTEQWSFRWSLPPIRVFQSAALPRLVFYDTRLTDFFCTVPTEYVKGRRLQIEYLKRYAPDLAKIKWQVYDTNLYRYQYFHTWLLPKRIFKKAWRILTRKKIIERNWEIQFLSPSGRNRLEQWLLEPGLKLHLYVPRDRIRHLLGIFFKSPVKSGLGYTVSMLLTFSAWLEYHGQNSSFNRRNIRATRDVPTEIN